MLKRRVAEFFAPDGPLARAFPDFESRPEQRTLALQVAQCIDARGSLLAEAGTGIGKTLAYLAPAVLSGLKVVVSTGTKTLQEQLLHQDLPLLARALGGPLNAEVMKGRSNYLCLLRANRFARQPLLPSVGDANLYQTLEAWRRITHTGDRAEVTGMPDEAPLWSDLSATSEQCLGKRCAEYERCFVTEMRRRAQSATLIIVNHHLYLSDLALRQRMGDKGLLLLPPHDIVIFDEAHDLDEVAAQHFGMGVSERRIEELCHDIQKALAMEFAAPEMVRPLLERTRQRTTDLFDALALGPSRTLLNAAATKPETKLRFRSLDQTFEELETVLLGQQGPDSAALARRTALIAAELAFILDLPPRASLVEEVPMGLRDASAEFVRYGDKSHRSRAVVARPIDVSRLMHTALNQVPSVLVSATLTVGGSFAHLRRRLGIHEAEELALGSPFDFEAHARIYLPLDLPEPDHPDFGDAASTRAAQLVAASRGGAFVLCTSHRMLPIMRLAIERDCDVPVLMQGERPRSHLIGAFREHGDAALVATLSFWQGVDVPGDALRLVIIDKLPFAAPNDPVLAARLDYLRKQGLDPFRNHQVPQAAILLRQGFGRLIRRKTDRGLVAILDRRVLTRSYGKIFVQSLPACPRLTEFSDAAAFLAAGAKDAPPREPTSQP